MLAVYLVILCVSPAVSQLISKLTHWAFENFCSALGYASFFGLQLMNFLRYTIYVSKHRVNSIAKVVV